MGVGTRVMKGKFEGFAEAKGANRGEGSGGGRTDLIENRSGRVGGETRRGLLKSDGREWEGGVGERWTGRGMGVMGWGMKKGLGIRISGVGRFGIRTGSGRREDRS